MASDRLQGSRRPDGTSPHELAIGEYAYLGTPGTLAQVPHTYGRCPTGDLANLSNHTIVVNPDGTFTVTPSIKVAGSSEWHGYLTNGVWIES